MAHTFGELVEKQQVANEAQAKFQALRDRYGPPAGEGWTDQQTETYETALRAWRDLEREVQAAVAEFAKEQRRARHEVEADVRARAGGPPAG
ncbi:hypothetical protein GCM10018793_49950 [Streptomyces sulfonofaciens]|uniref:Uncharacterized protein n=1 Tax=Streptomyces sulfonofaciens TaxID=68272 RepID=A0A919L6P2_9ACTN|nr:hypothetical protein [Streptomyces sulfonofaciens]GHH84716.1 hypothetical protein GCM10018793_49950 [Streptomyces sulfonofaciens]